MAKPFSQERFDQFVKILTTGDPENPDLRRQAWDIYLEENRFPGKIRLTKSLEQDIVLALRLTLDGTYIDKNVLDHISFFPRHDIGEGAFFNRHGGSVEQIEASQTFRQAMLEDIKPRSI